MPGGHLVRRLQQQGGFPDAGLAAHQHQGALHQTAPQHQVQLTDIGQHPFLFLQLDFVQSQGLDRDAGLLEGGPPVLGGPLLHQAVPGPALRALAHPLAVDEAAGLADKLTFPLRHPIPP